jgi:PST family polysaccharide transporter
MSMLTFGGHITGFNIVNYFARSFDNILIGRVWGSGPLGLYSKAYGLLMLPINQINAPISAVAIPALSRLQSDPERYRKYYCKSVSLIAFTTTPLIFAMAGVSDDLIRVVLGQQWLGAGSIFMILAIAAVGQPVSNSLGWVYISQGRTDRQMKWALVSSPVIVAGFVIGLPWGAIGVATAYAISCHVLRIPSWCYALRFSPVKLRDILGTIWRSFAASVIMFASIIYTRTSLSAVHPLQRLFLSCAVGFLVFITIVAVWPRARKETLGLLEGLNLFWNKNPEI